MGESLTAVASQFTAVLGNSAKISIDDIQNNLKIVITIASLYGIFILGCIFTNKWDRQDRIKHLRERHRRLSAVEPIKIGALMDKRTFLTENGFKAKFKALGRQAINGMKENHKLLSIVFKYDENFTRPQRLTVILTVTMSHMFSNALLYTLRQGPTTVASMLVSGLLTSICMMPVTIIFVIFFKKASKKHDFVMKYKYEDLEGNISEVHVDAYGNPCHVGESDAIKGNLKDIAQKLTEEHLTSICEKLDEQSLNRKLGSVAREVYLLFNEMEARMGITSNAARIAPKAKSYKRIEGDAGKEDALPVLKSKVAKYKKVGGTTESEVLHTTPSKGNPKVASLETELDVLLHFFDPERSPNFLRKLSQFDPIEISPHIYATIEETILSIDNLQDFQRGQKSTASSDIQGISDTTAIELLHEFVKQSYECATVYRTEISNTLIQAKQDLLASKAQLQETKKGLKLQMKVELESMVGEAQESIIASGLGKGKSRKQILKLAAKEVKNNRKKDLQRRISKFDDAMNFAKSESKEKGDTLKAIRRQSRIEAKSAKAKNNEQMLQVNESLDGVESMLGRIRMKLKEQKEKKLERLPLHEQQAQHLEEEKVRGMQLHAKIMYNLFLRRKPQQIRKPLFPEWLNYVIYLVCCLVCAFSGYYVIAFAIYIGEDESNAWMGSLFTGLAMTYVVTDPAKIFLKKGVLPLFAANLVAGTGVFDVLTGGSGVDGVAAAVGISVAGAAGMAGTKPKYEIRQKSSEKSSRTPNKRKIANSVTPIIEEGTRDHDAYDQKWKHLHEEISNDMIQMQNRPSHSDPPFSDQSSELGPDAGANFSQGIQLSEKKSSNAFDDNYDPLENALAGGFQMNRQSTSSNENKVIPSTNSTSGDPIILSCVCGLKVLESNLANHQSSECSHRLVKCTSGCGLELQARSLQAHELSQCRLVMCACNKIVFRQKLVYHVENECPKRTTLCSRGCGIEVSIEERVAHDRDICPMRVTKCQNCKTVMHAMDLPQHLQSSCPQLH